jgi:hypothetical protein
MGRLHEEFAVSKDEPGKEFSHVVEVDRIGPQGLHVQLEADQATCVALARRMRILAVLALKADLRVSPEPGVAGQYQVSGRLEAEVDQACVTSLEPVREVVSEAFVRHTSRRKPPSHPRPIWPRMRRNGWIRKRMIRPTRSSGGRLISVPWWPRNWRWG